MSASREGRVAFVTGSTTGPGKRLVQILAEAGAMGVGSGPITTAALRARVRRRSGVSGAPPGEAHAALAALGPLATGDEIARCH